MEANVRYLALLLTLVPSVALAQPVEPTECKNPDVCVPPGDMQDFLVGLRAEKCLKTTLPTVTMDRIAIVTDKDGRLFTSGDQPNPFTVKIDWCSYQATGTGKVDVYAAKAEPEIWGFRFRPKAYIGALPFEAAYALPEGETRTLMSLVDAGAMVDFLYYDWANLNAAVGFQSFGGGIGVDLTSNFGAYIGWAMTWATWHQNVNAGLWFSFWNPE
jgi:hypothetical protein